jgi:2-hydroxy-6-oxonona-2,4-dienedioate hydrolase
MKLPYRSIWTSLMSTPFKQAYTDVGGVRTRFVEAGDPDKTVLVMLHGTGANWEIYAPNIEAHAQEFHCFALDLLGHGFTDKPAGAYEIGDYVGHLLGFLDTQQIKSASFIGTSLGSWVATKLAAQSPERVNRLILLSPGGLAADLSTMKTISAVRTRAVDDPSWENVQGVLSTVIFKPHNILPDMIATRQAIYRQPSMKAGMQSILALQDPVIRARNLVSAEECASIRKPTLVIASSDDTDVFVTSSYEIAKLIPDARLVEMKGVGHMPQWEDPEVFNRHSLDFLKG